MPADSTLTLHEAAAELGVHYMTVYRYVRLGKLPARKIGSTWRVRKADLDRVRESPRPTGRGRARWDRRLEARLMAGDEPGAWGVIEAALASGMEPTQIYTRMLAPAMRAIGEGWEAGRVDVSVEHRASAIATRLIGRLGPSFLRRGRSRGVVVVTTPPGERHTLPGAMLADVLRGAHFDVVDLGADVPLASLGRILVDTDRLVAVCISVSRSGRDEAVAETIAAARRSAAVPVLVGGPAVEGADHARGLGADGFARTAPEAVAVLRALTEGAATDA